jgi:hypothetical protein
VLVATLSPIWRDVSTRFDDLPKRPMSFPATPRLASRAPRHMMGKPAGRQTLSAAGKIAPAAVRRRVIEVP